MEDLTPLINALQSVQSREKDGTALYDLFMQMTTGLADVIELLQAREKETEEPDDTEEKVRCICDAITAGFAKVRIEAPTVTVNNVVEPTPVQVNFTAPAVNIPPFQMPLVERRSVQVTIQRDDLGRAVGLTMAEV